MDANLEQPDFIRAEVSLREPHFDEEATMLSARPVVPLERVKSQIRSRRTVFFVIAVVGALLMGAVGGTMLFKQRAIQSNVANTETLTAPDVSTATGAVSGGSTNTEPAVTETVENEIDTPVVDQPKVVVRTEPRNNVSVISPRAERPRVVKEDQRDTRAERKEERREERKEARRLRRQAEREARTNQSGDDVMRIRDIFEGSPRP